MLAVRKDAAEMKQRNHASNHFRMGIVKWCLLKNGQEAAGTWGLQILP